MDAPTDNNTQQLEPVIAALGDFIHELNITRRHIFTYPAGHPMVDTAIEKVVTLLEPLFADQQNVSLGVAKEGIYFEGQWLKKDNPRFGDFASTLSELDIAAVHFKGKPDKSELLKFIELLNSDRQKITEQGGLEEVLAEKQFQQLAIDPVDYSLFQATDTEQGDGVAWESFLFGLLGDSLPDSCESIKDLSHLNAKAIAEILNQNYAVSSSVQAAQYDQAIARFVKQLQPEGQGEETPGQRLYQLIEQLSPELRQQFLNSTFRHLDQDPAASEETLQALPSSMIDLTLQELNQKNLQVSSTMLNLIGNLSQHHRRKQSGVTSGMTEELEFSEQIKTLFREEEEGKFTPEKYQSILDNIAGEEFDFQLNSDETEQLRKKILNSSTERHNCAIIFNLLAEQELSAEQAEGMVTNLADIAYFFLETGDFKGLGYLHQRLAQFCQQHSTQILNRVAFLEELLNSQEFQQELLDNLSRWDENKQREINAYIRFAGRSIAESLVQRLSEEEDKSLRRVYLNTLISMGKTAHPVIYQHLKDERWFVVRNLLTALRQQDDPVDVGKLLFLEKHSHLRVNQELSQLLFKFDRDQANKLLTKQLKSNDPQLRQHAIQLAENSQDQGINKQLITLLFAEKISDSNLAIKQQLIRTLCGIGAETSLPELEKLLKPGLLFTPKNKQELQKEIIRNLDKFPLQDSKPILQKLANSSNKLLSGLATDKLRQIARKQA